MPTLDGFARTLMLLHGRPMPITLFVACRVVYCGQMVHDRPMMCIEVDVGVAISIQTIFDPFGPH